jgi:AcrR family transcriptional regulator
MDPFDAEFARVRFGTDVPAWSSVSGLGSPFQRIPLQIPRLGQGQVTLGRVPSPRKSSVERGTRGSRRGELSRDAICKVSLTRFAHQGYHATSLREIAADLSVTVAAIYYHFNSKEELLTEIVERSLQADFAAAAEIRNGGAEPILDALIRMHVKRHVELRDEALVVHHESKYLPEPYAGRVRVLLREYEALFRDAIVLEHDIPPERLSMVTKVVLGMGAAVIHWFNPNALLSVEQVADRYVLYIRSILDVEAHESADAP